MTRTRAGWRYTYGLWWNGKWAIFRNPLGTGNLWCAFVSMDVGPFRVVAPSFTECRHRVATLAGVNGAPALETEIG